MQVSGQGWRVNSKTAESFFLVSINVIREASSQYICKHASLMSTCVSDHSLYKAGAERV